MSRTAIPGVGRADQVCGSAQSDGKYRCSCSALNAITVPLGRPFSTLG